MTIIRGGRIYDGSGGPPFKGDVLIEDGVVKDIGHYAAPGGAEVVDAADLAVAPGFIDIHGHSDLEILRNPAMEAKTGQGITTEVAGNCGIGVFPILGENRIPKALLTDILGPCPCFDWTDYLSYKTHINSPYSLFMLQSHSMLRFNAIEGNPNREASEDEIKTMENLLDLSLDQGCLGLSTGLFYAPCAFASHKELARLAKVVARRNGLLAVHQRCEGSAILSSLDEIIKVAEEAGARLEISHLKIIGGDNQDLLGEALKRLEGCRCPAGFDQYPYNYGTTSLASLLPPDILALDPARRNAALRDPASREAAKASMRDPHGWDSITSLVGMGNIFLSNLEVFASCNKKSLEDIGALRGQDPYDSLLDILAGETGNATMIDVTESEETLRRIFRHRMGVFGTDALYNGRPSHPRSFGAAPRALERDFLEKAGMTLEAAIHRMTGETALRLGLSDRGFVRKGLRADIVVFDPASIADTGSWDEPDRGPRGIKEVFVGGVPVLGLKKPDGLARANKKS